MNKKKIENENLLWDFLYWARDRRTSDDSAPVSEKTLKYVADGIERFLDGKTAWSSPKGRSKDPNLMWLCFHLVHSDHLPRHSQLNGGFSEVEKLLYLGDKVCRNNYYGALKK